jgi:homogentisate 1,2-dioxygenase
MFQNLHYLNGFNNHLSSEALDGALPRHQNSPQVCPYNLYAEQISGTAFTVPRATNLKSYCNFLQIRAILNFKFSWLYRIQPSVGHTPFEKVDHPFLPERFALDLIFTPTQLRWNPFSLPTAKESIDFIQGLRLVAGSGDPAVKNGVGIYVYIANTDMKCSSFHNADGDFLIGI